ncbi:hypothetical protein WN944_018960 [Citrus x changshan-huyou]|uniref:Uncharacterized protein n=1 Tax=Citrus x changshan-huyou TaxID=2935761 RepID=A0AAP0QDL5_9ROSI
MRRLHLLWSKICKEILVGFNVLAARQGATRCMTTKKKSMMEIESVEAAGKSNIGRVKRKKDESHESEFKDAINGATSCMTTQKKSMMEIESVEVAGKSDIGCSLIFSTIHLDFVAERGF